MKLKISFPSMLSKWGILLYCLCCQVSIQAQYTPYFQNYDLSQYNAGNQNWGISKAQDGRVFVANNKGLLEYDGLKWTLSILPNKTTIRSVLALENKIYTGSYEEFGFWERSALGQLEYHSLSEKLETNDFLNEEFWQITEMDDAIVFRSFSNIYIYSAGQIEKITPPSTVISCSFVDGTLYVATLTNGIFSYTNGALIAFVDHKDLYDSKIVAITKKDNAFFIATSLRGIFKFKNGILSPWKSDINPVLKEQQLNTFSEMGNGNMIFGTIKNGVYISDSEGKQLFHIHKENGLSNNTVLSQYSDADDQLWLGLDNGLAAADLNSPYWFYNDVSGNLGAVYDVIKYQNTIYIGSNTGLYYLDATNTLQFVEGSQGQVWDLVEIEGDLFCGHNNGTYLVENKKLKLISTHTGGWVTKKVTGIPKTYIQGTYAGLVKFQKGNNGWTVKKIGETTIPSRFLVFEDAHTAWVAHAYKGLYRIKFNPSYDSIITIKNYEHKGLWSPYNVRVHALKNEITIKTNGGWQKYEPLLDTIVSYPLLNKSFGKNSYIISETDLHTFAIKNNTKIDFKTFPEDGFESSLSDKYFKQRLIIGYENISKLTETMSALSLNNGYLLFDQASASTSDIVYQPDFENIRIDNQLISVDSVKAIQLDNNYQSLTLSLTSAKSKDHFFEYAFETSKALQWYKMDNDKLELSNLNYGEYQLLFRTVNHFGSVSPARQLIIKVLPPFFRSAQGYLMLTLLLVLLIAVLYALHRRKIKREKFRLHKKFELEQMAFLKEKTIENEKRLVDLKNESLKNEVTLKSKQLANTAMALLKKNEMLLELKNELAIHKNSFDNSFSFKNLVKKIETSISHKDEWKVFEYNFNQVHEEFFTQLKNAHPQLNAKDLRVSAYIKMNLSTKEIAPLLNISVRGVETQRYRLKNKLNLETDQSLTDYLQNFK